MKLLRGFEVKKSTLIIIAGIAAVVIIGVVVYLVVNNKDDSSESSQTQTQKSEPTFAYADACDVLTPEEIGAALGGTYGAGEKDLSNTSSDGLKGTSCYYKQVSDDTTAGLTAALNLNVEIKNYKSNDNAHTYFESYSANVTQDGDDISLGTTKVNGVGDEAIFVVANTTVDEKTEALYIRKDNQIIVLTATRLDGIADRATLRTQMTELAKNL
jgi:hypothetical protein